jgi:hypothetical protein
MDESGGLENFRLTQVTSGETCADSRFDGGADL